MYNIIPLGLGVGIICAWLFGVWMRKGSFSTTRQVNGKTIIITGANTGCGKETARELGRRGGHVILACRDVIKAKKTAEELRADNRGSYTVKRLDLASFASIRKFAEDVLQTEEHIHMLINNAGVMMCPQQQTEDGHEMQFGVNHLGHFLLTLLLLDRIKSSSPAKIINLTSYAHANGAMQWEDLNMDKNYSDVAAYAQSKLANILFTRELARRVKGFGVNVYAVHPGMVQTELCRHVFANYNVFLALATRLFVQMFGKTPDEGSRTTLYCALHPEQDHVTGKYYSDCVEASPLSHAQDDVAATRLWDISINLVNITDPTSN